ncbi:MAG: MFS transporter [Thiotrichales bacterium]|nr:MFS transporter [Thiotrichales bacterium]
MGRQNPSIETTYGWVVVLASLALHSIALGAPTILFVALKPIAADLDTARAVPSLAYSLLMVGAGIGGIAMGRWMDRYGVMQPVLFGSVMICLGALLAGHAEDRWSLFIATGVFIGLLGKAAMIAPLVANVTRWFDRRRGLAVAILTSGQGLAGAVWPPIVQHFNDLVGWRGTFLYFAGFGVATMVPAALLLRPRPPIAAPDRPAAGTSSGDERRVLDLPPHVAQIMLWIAVIGCCTAMSVPIVHLVSHVTDQGYTLQQGARALSVLFVAAFLSRLGFGVLADRIGPVRTLLIGSASMAAMLLAFAFATSYTGLFIAALLFGLGFSGIMPCYPLIIRLLFPVKQLGGRIAAQYMFAASGMALGGWLGGITFDLTGRYQPAFLIAFAFNAVNFVVMGFFHFRQTRLRLAPHPA